MSRDPTEKPVVTPIVAIRGFVVPIRVVRMPSRSQGTMVVVCRGFLRGLQENGEVLPRLGHNRYIQILNN